MGYFVIHCLDAADALPRRLHHYDDHKAYLASATIRILISGPLLADNEEMMIGSFFLVEAPGKADAEAFNAADPFRLTGVWETVRIDAFHKRVDVRGHDPARE